MQILPPHSARTAPKLLSSQSCPIPICHALPVVQETTVRERFDTPAVEVHAAPAHRKVTCGNSPSAPWIDGQEVHGSCDGAIVYSWMIICELSCDDSF